MRVADIVRRAGKNLRQAKGRTVLTSLAIAVGAFTIALAMAAGNGGRNYLDKQVSAAGDMSTIQVSAKQNFDTTQDDKPKKVGENAPTTERNAYKELTPADRTKIAAIDGVEKVLPIFSVDAYSVAANGSDPYEGYMKVQYDGTAIDLMAGNLADGNEILPGQVVLPHKYIESFGFASAEAALGKKVTATFNVNAPDGNTFSREFTIVAVDKQPTSPLAFYQDEFRISNKDGEAIAAMQRPPEATESFFAFMVTARKGANVDTVKQAIEGAGDYAAMTFAEMRTSIMQMVNIVQYGLMGFGALAILASIFGIINTQYISVLERTQQIGLMKALGARGKDIGKLFRYEAAWIGFLGGVIGVGLAYLVTLFNPVIVDVLKLEEGTALLQMDWLLSGALVAGLMIVAILSGWFPSRKASKLDPIEALRTE